MLERLKTFDIERMDIEEGVALLSFARAIRAEYETLALDVPEWLDTRTRELTREIRTRNQDSIDMQLRKLRALQEADLTPTERREKRAAEIARLEQLAQK